MQLYFCPVCGHQVLSSHQPEPMSWSDGHICYFKLVPEDPSLAIVTEEVT